jgi:hypothetical protein
MNNMDYLNSVSQKPNFKIGDVVTCEYNFGSLQLRLNEWYTVADIEYDVDDDAWYVALKELNLEWGCEWYASRFKKVN